MKKIIPFKKEIIFSNNILEITSISLENNLHKEKDNLITGNFIISGDYKIDNITKNTEVFNYEIPFDINIDEKYNIDNIVIDIEDFYYEIVNKQVMEVNIEVSIDKIEEIELPTRCIEKEDILENTIDLKDNQEEIFKDIKQEDKKEENDTQDEKDKKEEKDITQIFNNSEETYKTYKVYIVKKEDTIEKILDQFKIKKETLSLYNNINEIKEKDKLIIPDINESN